ncbi:MAG: hypothetical protein ABSA39_03495 [Edaphobacter sp.]
MRCKNAVRFSLISTLLLATLHAQNPPADSPVGHWVAEHPSQGGVGSWWDFHPDGTLTMHIGAMVTLSFTRSGNTFTSPSGADSAPITVSFRVDNDTLHITAPNTPEQLFTRIGPSPSSADPLLGKWKPLPPATPSTDPNIAAQQKAMADAILVFSTDNTESVRIPFSNYEGAWDAATHTYHLNNQPICTFQRTGAKLILGQPPDSHKTETYIADSVL